ncbi:MAG: hypothetical protein RIB80_07775 [Rhodospirillales bacterium]
MTTVSDNPFFGQKPGSIHIDACSTARLKDMEQAAATVQENLRKLASQSATVITEILKGQGDFVPWDHYPAGDVYDWDSHAQYYYHAHPADNPAPGGPYGFWKREHGHFHTFLRAKGMPPGTLPADVPGVDTNQDSDTALCHIVAISMNEDGLPFRLFTTNRWVTGEQWHDAETVIGLIDRFSLTCALPSRPVNSWITAMLRLFRPQVEELLRQRDAALANRLSRPATVEPSAFDDRGLEITSVMEISIEDQMDMLTAELRRRRITTET